MVERAANNEKLTDAFAELVRVHRRRAQSKGDKGLIDKVYGHVVERVCRQEWTAGDKINEARLARELGISHVPVREAMERLRQEGWVERIPNRGVFLRKFDLEAIRELFQIREMLEAEAVRTLAPKVNPEQLAELRRVVELQLSAKQAGNHGLMREADTHFHRLLIHFVGNRRLERMFASVLMQARGCLFLITNSLPFHAHAVQEILKRADHQHVYRALERRDADLAVRLVREHVRIGCVAATKLAEMVSDIARRDHGRL
jgi:DNA-binding GntR family transcriptional regulator